MDGSDRQRTKRSKVIDWAKIKTWKNPWDLDDPDPPDFTGDEWNVSDILLNWTLSEPSVRGDKPLLKVLQEEREGGGE